jgi:hypothetical protein
MDEMGGMPRFMLENPEKTLFIRMLNFSTRSVSKNRKNWVDFMMRFELGLEKPDPTKPSGDPVLFPGPFLPVQQDRNKFMLSLRAEVPDEKAVTCEELARRAEASCRFYLRNGR